MLLFISLLAALSCLALGSAVSEYLEPNCDGRTVIVHLFEWKWSDVADECERYLGPKGFCGVQISPPMENVVVTTDAERPWWERYQPVSYILETRSGDETDFADMVDRCKAAGVRIYADVVFNHMAGSDRSGYGTAGTYFDGYSKDFPGVPYEYDHFHTSADCGSSSGGIDYQVASQVRNCDLVGLRDLDHAQTYVQDKVAEYLNHLVDLGVAGFRVDAAKHMWPDDLLTIQDKVNNIPEGGRPFFYHEVIDWGTEAVKDDEYFANGYVTEFRYHQKVKDGVNYFSNLRYVYDTSWSMVPPEQALVFVDNHDTQRQSGTLTYKDGATYQRAVAFTLANDYGFTRVMSSYEFYYSDEGPPHESDYSIADVTINSDGSCGNGWVCEHRWNMIGNMARFRTYVDGEGVSNWADSSSVLSFSRGNKGFFAMGTSSFSLSRETGLPAGEYCDLISDCATTITVDSSGYALISPAESSEPFLAITTEEGFTPAEEIVSATDGPTVTDEPTETDEPDDEDIDIQETTTEAPGEDEPDDSGDDEDFRRTVVIVEQYTSYGEDVFLRGGVDESLRSGCTDVAATSPCSVPIIHGDDYVGSHYDTLNAWKVGDNFLDWIGEEPGQGTYYGEIAQGTPGFWSTNDPSNSGYSPLNHWGDHYWIFDFEMDCSKTEGGYFQIRANVEGLQESRLSDPIPTCSGDAAPAENPFDSVFHIARCGYLNVFHYNDEECEISTL